MSEKALTHKELSVLLGVSETTVKSYRRKFPGSIPVANKGKPIRFKPEAAGICLRIRDLFAEGMSVEEVGARLTQEFGWRRPRSAESAVRPPQKKNGGVDLSQSFATALGNMAKSMISLNQSHTGILNTLKNVETMLGEIGLGNFKIDAEAIVDARRKNEAVASEAFTGITRAMDQAAATLESTGVALEESRELRREQARENAVIIETLEKVLEALRDVSARPALSAPPERPKVVYLHQERSAGESAASSVQPETASDLSPDFSEAPRRLLQLPLVVRLENGTYISAGGKSLGKITLNDVKAMLAQSYLPPDNFQLRWERDPEGIWAVLEQREGTALRLLTSEIVSARGTSVLEVAAFKEEGVQQHPVDFCRFLGEIGR
ncbi:MAG: helix-turn-helix domain-containing protein [Deltaproteobacteria bacterium]|jgi:hypothetical protein|nr:helix-turn-helix domain-containing protein [Deltaproteobacteria bacterium]